MLIYVCSKDQSIYVCMHVYKYTCVRMHGMCICQFKSACLECVVFFSVCSEGLFTLLKQQQPVRRGRRHTDSLTNGWTDGRTYRHRASLNISNLKSTSQGMGCIFLLPGIKPRQPRNINHFVLSIQTNGITRKSSIEMLHGEKHLIFFYST